MGYALHGQAIGWSVRRRFGKPVVGEREPFASLVARWRAQADHYEQDGVPGHAALLRRVAAELYEATTRYELEELTPTEAAAETGYSASQLRKRFPGQRTIPRKDLPHKGTRRLGPDLASAVLRERGKA